VVLLLNGEVVVVMVLALFLASLMLPLLFLLLWLLHLLDWHKAGRKHLISAVDNIISRDSGNEAANRDAVASTRDGGVEPHGRGAVYIRGVDLSR
jgi:hypothetical protein